LHISYSLYILHNLVSTSDDELEAPGTELLSDVCVMVFFVVSGVAPPGFSEFAGNIRII